MPPPVTELESCLGALERFFHDDTSRLPALIKAGLMHVQFETIHPFLDGNRRIGRVYSYRRYLDILREGTEPLPISL